MVEYNISVMADPETNSHDRKILGNILVLGSSASGKMPLVQEMASNFMFRKLEGIHKVSAIKLSKASEAEIDSCFKLKVEFYNPQNEYNLRKTSVGLENLYKEKLKKKKIVVENSGNGKGEYMKRDNLILLDDVTGLADRSHSFVKLFDNVQKIWIHCIIHIS